MTLLSFVTASEGRCSLQDRKQQTSAEAEALFCRLSSVVCLLVEEVLAPAVIATPQHAHDLAASVQRERARLAL